MRPADGVAAAAVTPGYTDVRMEYCVVEIVRHCNHIWRCIPCDMFNCTHKNEKCATYVLARAPNTTVSDDADQL